MFEYMTIGTLFINNINFADGTKKEGIMGGGGLFAYCGMLQYTENALLLSAVGTDVEEHFGPWLTHNKISRTGFVRYSNKNTVATMQYQPDGQWNETFAHGPRALGKDINCLDGDTLLHMGKVVSKGLKGVYFCAGVHNDLFFNELTKMRDEFGFKVMYELFTEECKPENLHSFVTKAFPKVDIFSLNRTESYTLFGVADEQSAIEKITKIGIPCFYRVGSKGSYMIQDGKAEFMPTAHLVPKEQEVDPTGCGNCSTSAALWAYCEGYSSKQIASIANVAAGYNVQQYGPYPVFNSFTRKEALETALRLAAE